MSLTLSPTHDHAGRVDGVSSIGRDITSEVANAEALREAERKMRAAQELAAIGTLTAGLAHEVGTPMNVILGYAQLLEAEASDEGARETAHTIVGQVRRVTGIIETLLNIARPRERRRVSVDLSGIVDTSVAFLSEKLARRHIAVEREEEVSPPVSGDPERLQQLFLNLFLNAADAMPRGGRIRIELRPAGARHVEVRIQDTGSGISEEALPQIFEPFFTTKTRGAGTGLGLAVCKGIVLDHEGEIDVQSEVGKGSEFLIRFPTQLGSAS
jgi:signal transduction histidine kinase